MTHTYTTWEEALTQLIADSLEASFSDAAGVVEGQPFYIQQSWTKGMSPEETCTKILAAISSDD